MSSNISASSFLNYWPNISAYQALGNRAFSVTGLGGEKNIRFSTLPDGYSNMTYQLFSQNSNSNPNGWCQWNPMLIGMPLNNGMATDPALIQQGNVAAANWGAQLSAQYDFNSIVQQLTGFQSQLTNILKSDKLNESQKQRLQAVLDKIDELVKQVQAKSKAGALSTDEMKAYSKQISDVINKAAEVANDVMKEVQEAEDKKAEDADKADGSDKADDEKSDGKSDNKVDDKTEAGKKQKELEKSAVAVCQDIYSGLESDLIGTDYDKLKAGVTKINKDNVATVLNTWDKQYRKNGKSLVERLFDTEWVWNDKLSNKAQEGQLISDPGNSNTNMIWNIVASLDQKAQALDIKTELGGQFATAYTQLRKTFIDQKAVIDAVAEIQKAVTKAENEASAKSSKEEIDGKNKAEAANKKAEADRKEKAEKAKKEKEAKALFLNDMREILGDDKAEISDKVHYKDGKFIVRVDGVDYEASSYVELVKVLKQAGYKEPAQYLKKASVNKKA